ncbi:MAG: STAS domain-containing protein [Pseudomonadales bacterium]|nr:STAS domain-containing protein [Pseudomonadales bacterium]
MDINSQLSDDKKTLTLILLGKFDYTCHQEFQDAYESVEPVPGKFVIDALEVTSIDSSALGMLLLLRNHAGGDDSDVAIVNAKPDVYKLLHTCKFDELFALKAL